MHAGVATSCDSKLQNNLMVWHFGCSSDANVTQLFQVTATSGYLLIVVAAALVIVVLVLKCQRLLT